MIVHCAYRPYYLYLFFVHGHLGCFHILAIVNIARRTMGMHVFLGYVHFASSGYMYRSGRSGSYYRSIFSLLRNLHTVLHNGYTTLYSHWSGWKFLFCYYHSGLLNKGHTNSSINPFFLNVILHHCAPDVSFRFLHNSQSPTKTKILIISFPYFLLPKENSLICLCIVL